jgi:NAD(P)-dependent dehydrogenase (short-subunit alcohol dehydrogenase family)
MDSMRGKVCVITGATSGIGRAAALELGRAGADLFMIGRSLPRANRVLRRLRSNPGCGQARFLKCDISDQQQVRETAAAIRAAAPRVDVLVNNAGARFESFQRSADGIEMTFAANHLSHFLLTALLLESLMKAPESRIITTAGARHRGASSDFERCLRAETFERRAALSTVKLAAVAFTYELASRLKGTGITVNAVNPGAVATRAGCNGRVVPWMRHIVSHALRGGLISSREGADTLVFLASSPDVREITGTHFYRRKPQETSPESHSEEVARKLWTQSVSMAKLDAGIGMAWRFFRP